MLNAERLIKGKTNQTAKCSCLHKGETTLKCCMTTLPKTGDSLTRLMSLDTIGSQSDASSNIEVHDGGMARLRWLSRPAEFL